MKEHDQQNQLVTGISHENVKLSCKNEKEKGKRKGAYTIIEEKKEKEENWVEVHSPNHDRPRFERRFIPANTSLVQQGLG